MTQTRVDAERSSVDDGSERAGILPYIEVGKQVMAEFKDDDVPDVAAGIAYHAVFAIPPMIIFIVTLAALFEQVTSIDVAGQLLDLIEERAPEETQQLLTNLVNSAIADVSGGVASVGVAVSAIIALWSGSNGVATITRAFNRAYDVKEDRSFIKQKALAIGLTIVMGVMVILAFALFVFGEQIGNWAARQLGLSSAFEIAWNIARWPLAILLFMFMLAMLYSLGPNIKQPFRWISPGAVIATILWGIVVYGFKIYVTYANPGSAYGAVGSVVILLFFFYLSGIVFLIGAEINAVVRRRSDQHTDEHLTQNANAANVVKQPGGEPEQPEGATTASSERAAARQPKKVKRGGVGELIGTMIGSRILKFTSSKFRKAKKNDEPR